MDSSENVGNVEMSQNKTDEDFVTVSRQSRKRKQIASSMDTCDTDVKRPYLPPISGDKLKVYYTMWFCGSPLVSCRAAFNIAHNTSTTSYVAKSIDLETDVRERPQLDITTMYSVA